MFKNLFGKKNDGFYLQLEDSDATSKPVEKAPAKPAPAAAPKAEPTATADTAAAPKAQTEDKAAKTEKKSVKKAEAPKAAEAPAPVAAPAPVVPAATTFAPDYLIKPSSRSTRRMPGANMNGFLDMARQAKKPANIK